MTNKVRVSKHYIITTVFAITTVALAPQPSAAQGGPPSGGGGGNALTARVGNLESGLAAEIAERVNADNQEAADRETGDNVLEIQLDQETASRQAGDSAVQANLDQETANRQAGDGAVQANLDQEAADRAADVDAEASARSSADDVLAADLDTLAEVLCQAVQGMAGNPSPEAIALCGNRLFKTVFTTSTTYDGDLKTAGEGATGLDGGDNICNARARAAGLPGTYTAWLSSSVTNARDRVTQASVPYQRTDGVQVVDDFADLLDCSDTCLDAPILLTEFGAFGSIVAWTGTDQTGGKGYLNQCGDWTTSNAGAFFGDTRETGPRWTGIGWWPCDRQLALYCVQD